MICESCQACIDFMGTPCLPQYGIAPHRHAFFVLGATEFVPRSEWPDNFVEDPKQPYEGTWFCATQGCENSKELYRDEWSKPRT